VHYSLVAKEQPGRSACRWRSECAVRSRRSSIFLESVTFPAQLYGQAAEHV